MGKLINFPNGPSASSRSGVARKVRRRGKVLQMKKQSEYLTTGQVAEWLGYGTRTTTDWAQRYQDTGGVEGIPGVKFGRRAWRFERTAIEGWIETRFNQVQIQQTKQKAIA
jgi:excisionase family DNA binding protein